MSSQSLPEGIFDQKTILEILKFTFESMNQGMAFFDKQFNLIAWNKRFELMDIYPEDSLVYGKSLFEIYVQIARRGVFGEGDYEALAQKHIEMIKMGLMERTQLVYPPTGKIVAVRRYRYEPFGIVAIFTDVTLQENAKKRRVMRDQLDAIGFVSQNLAHDFNNQLSILHSSLELIEMTEADRLSKEGNELLNQAISTCYDTENIIKDIVSRNSSSSVVEPINNIHNWLKEKQTRLETLVDKTVEFSVELETDNLSIFVSESGLEQALINLVKNANEAKPKSCIKLSSHRQNQLKLDAKFPQLEIGEFLVISVYDDGNGILEHRDEDIFDVFVTSKEVNKGRGIGLAQARQFAENSGGKIEYSSEPKIGTQMNLWLPIMKQDHLFADSSGFTSDKDEASQDLSTIWVLDDNKEFAQVVAKSLSEMKYKTNFFYHPDDFWAAIQNTENMPDIILSDIRLNADLNGIDLAIKLRKEKYKGRIILTTGYDEEYQLRMTQETILDDVPLIAKPFSVLDFVQLTKNTYSRKKHILNQHSLLNSKKDFDEYW